MWKSVVEQTDAREVEQRSILLELNRLRQRMITCGMVLTFHATGEALSVAGYEVAALLQGTWPDEALDTIEKEASWRTLHRIKGG